MSTPDAPGLTEGVPESRALTGLRGVAATLVVLHHAALYFHLPSVLPGTRFLVSKGYLGVDLFFVLSGFVLSMVYGNWFAGGRPASMIDWSRFLLRRVARLLPLQAATLLLVLLLVAWPLPWQQGAEQPFVSWRRVLANLAMVQAWGISGSINPPSWSVSTEFAAYLAFAPLAMLGLRRRRGAVVTLLLAAGLLLAALWFAPPRGPEQRGLLDIHGNESLRPLARCLAGFILGMAAWRLGRRPNVRRLAEWPPAAAALALVTAAALVGRVTDLAVLLLLPVLVLALHFGRGRTARALGSRLPHRLGLLSYAIYLVHLPLLTALPPEPVGLVLPAFLATVIVAAWALYVLVEVPGRALLRAGGERVLRALPAGGAPLRDTAGWPK